MFHRTRIFLVFFLVLASVTFTSTVFGQVRRQPYRLNDRELGRIITQIEQQSDRFRSSLDSALDKSRFDGTAREDNINAFVKDFYRQTKNLRNRFNRHKSAAADVQSVLEKTRRIDSFMRRYPLSSTAQNDWSTLKTSLDELAAAYNVSWRWFEYPGGPPSGSGGYPMGTAVSEIPYRVSDRDLERIIRRIEQQSDRFRSALDSALDKSRFDGSSREDDINAFVKEFYRETKALHDHFNDHRSTSADVESLLNRAVSIDRFMRRNRFKGNAEKEWINVRANLDELARVYNVTWRWGA
jgi:hypothetical protein